MGLAEVGQVTVRRYTHLSQTEAWLTRTMPAILAGRLAEMLVVGEALAGSGTGAESDRARPAGIALDTETSLGFIELRTLLYRPSARGFVFLEFDCELQDRFYARLLAAEVMARGVLEEHGAKLMAIATRLRQTGTMSVDEVRLLMGRGGHGTGVEDCETRL